MQKIIQPGSVSGKIAIPGSKSHTIRALVIGTLARGTSRLQAPLDSEDTRACVDVCRALGGRIELGKEEWTVHGTAGKVHTPEDIVNVHNSGTTLSMALGAASLGEGWTVFTGDTQIRKRPMGPLLSSLKDLGAEAFSTQDNGCPPLSVRGPLKGGDTRIACPTSQYLSSLLINCPLAGKDTRIHVTELNEQPYVEMTMHWLDKQDIRCSREGFSFFHIEGGQSYRAFSGKIPADYSSATFFLCAAAVTGSRLTLLGLDPDDCQGDREVISILEGMGCRFRREEKSLTVEGGSLQGQDLDLNGIPDALPALAVVGCRAAGTTRLLNVPQARIKETDRITVMKKELSKMGARVEELPDGLIIHESDLSGTDVDGHSDHRIVMALAVAGLIAEGETRISAAEAAAVTFPDFFNLRDQIQKK
jgi:3-phosphoshikimate 1-carboxyvinyltransferase